MELKLIVLECAREQVLLRFALNMVLTLFGNRYELKKGLDDPTISMLSNDADGEVLEFLEKLVELSPAFGKKLHDIDPDIKKEWHEFLGKYCPRSKYLK